MRPKRTAVGVLAVVCLLMNVSCFQAGESDAQIQKRIQRALTSDPALSGQQVGVAVQNGVAALLGRVSTPEQVQAAIRDANFKGIVQIVNAVRASPPLETLSVNETGQGSITSADGKINCSNGGGACSASYPAGTAITLNAAAANGWKPQGWSGGTEGSCNDPNTCAVTMNGAMNLTATFVPSVASPAKTGPPQISDPAASRPSISASAEPPSITAGSASTLAWSSRGAVRVTLDGQMVRLHGTEKVSPSASRTYVFVATNASGMATSFPVNVTVSSAPAPTILLRLDRPRIVVGQRATLTWASTNASSVTINGQTQAANGSVFVSPQAATNYQAIATNASGATAVANAYLNVIRSVPVTVPAGTDVFIRMIDTVDSSKNHAGDPFQASLEQALQAGGYVVGKKNADVTGRVVEVKQPGFFGRVAGEHELQIELTGMRDVNGQMQPIRTQVLTMRFSNLQGSAPPVIVGGAVGAAIGALVGGGKGAAAGAVTGGSAGVVERLIFSKNKLVISSEQICQFTLRQPLVVTVRPQ